MENFPGRTHAPRQWARSQVAGLLAVAAVLVLVGSLFFHWAQVPYGTDTPGQTDTFPMNGWESLEAGDALFIFIAIVIATMVSMRRLDGPWLLLLGIAAASTVLAFLFSTVPLAEYSALFHEGVEPGRGPGSWIAAGGAALLVVAGLIQAKAWAAEHPAGS